MPKTLLQASWCLGRSSLATHVEGLLAIMLSPHDVSRLMNQKHVAWLYNYMITQLSLDLFYHNMIIYVGILHTNRNVDVLQDLLKKITRHIKKSNNNETINWMPTNRIKLKMCNHVPTHTLPIFNSSNSALLKFSELIIFGDSFLFEMAKQRN